MSNERDTTLEGMLDALGAADRAAPDAGFEHRIASHSTGTQRRIPGRRRLVLVPAMFGGIAALVAAAVLLPIARPAGPSMPIEDDASTKSIAEMSFTLFDEAFGEGTTLAYESDAADLFDPASVDDWFLSGDSL
ncbi:MAG: hypothetical protein AAFS11_02010 [Planctomycetota bacterium]